MGEEEETEGAERGLRISWSVHFVLWLLSRILSICSIDEEQQARRRYKKDLAHLKPDLAAYNKQKALAEGNGEGSSSSAVTTFNPQGDAVCTVCQYLLVPN